MKRETMAKLRDIKIKYPKEWKAWKDAMSELVMESAELVGASHGPLDATKAVYMAGFIAGLKKAHDMAYYDEELSETNNEGDK